MHVKLGDVVKWSNGRKPLGRVVQIFTLRGKNFAVVEDEMEGLRVVRIYEKLTVVR